MDTSLRSILAAAGTPDDLIAYVEARGIVSPEIYAELGDDVKEFDQAMVDSLASLVKLRHGPLCGQSSTATRLELGRKPGPDCLGFVRRFGCCYVVFDQDQRAPSWLLASTSSQIRGSDDTWRARKFPEMTLLGAEAVLAKLLTDAVPLEETVQHGHTSQRPSCRLLPNMLSSARKRARSQEQV